MAPGSESDARTAELDAAFFAWMRAQGDGVDDGLLWGVWNAAWAACLAAAAAREANLRADLDRQVAAHKTKNHHIRALQSERTKLARFKRHVLTLIAAWKQSEAHYAGIDRCSACRVLRDGVSLLDKTETPVLKPEVMVLLSDSQIAMQEGRFVSHEEVIEKYGGEEASRS